MRIRNSVLRVATGVVVCVATVTAAPFATAATTGSNNIDQHKVDVANKAAGLGGVRPMTGTSLSETGTVGCENANARAYYNDSISYGWTSGQVSGNSQVAYFGSTPYNADSMTMHDGLNISGPYVGWNNPGSNWYWGTDTIIMNQSQNNAWLANNSYNASWQGFPAYYAHDTNGNFVFAGVTCNPDASGTKYL